eukprot:TRINITY_DN4712_c0_g1_i1.p1 TRINITY_DN4712_c0_g1~~TRINITY_DN4712_c0_g1_i1.p1  ORF type:complete len:892 (-),score=224.55 TRINITY_DN4712_c0_g1_i1:1370-3667(-)
MKGGGSYFMISRSLGPELGGAIGVLFYLAYAIGTCFYVIGFATEVQTTFFPDHSGRLFITAIGSAVLFVILLISLAGAKIFTKFNLILFILQFGGIFYALISLISRAGPINLSSGGSFSGLSLHNLKSNLMPDYTVSPQCDDTMCNYSKVFAVIFPAVTGIMEGANLSGDLKNPRKTIGKGTLLAVFLAFLTYLSLVLTQASAYDRDTLRTNMNVLQETAGVPAGVIVGVLIATSSSALGAIFGGSRVLQALARDKLFPGTEWLGKGSPGADEPRRAVFFTWFIAQAALFLGDLDIVAPIITSFFCLSYAITNFSALLLRVSGTPNFRPTFKYFNAYTALLGGLLNIAIMFWLSPVNAVVALVCLYLIYLFISFRHLELAWGDVSQALLFHQVRKYLLQLDERKNHGKLWRPSVLLYVDNLGGHLASFCNRMKKGGLFVLGAVVVGDFDHLQEPAAQLKSEMVNFIENSDLKGFPQVTIAPTARLGFQSLLQLSGLGAMSPNTVVVPLLTQKVEGICDSEVDQLDLEGNDVDKLELTPLQKVSNLVNHEIHNDRFLSAVSDKLEYVCVLQDVLRAEKNLVVAANFSTGSSMTDVDVGKIDVWLTESNCTQSWSAFCENALMLLQLAHVIQVQRKTANFDIRVFLLTSGLKDFERRKLEILIAEARIEVSEVIVFDAISVPAVVSEDELQIPNLKYIERLQFEVAERSKDTDMIFLDLPQLLPKQKFSPALADAYLLALEKLSQDLPWTLMVQQGDASESIMSRDL